MLEGKTISYLINIMKKSQHILFYETSAVQVDKNIVPLMKVTNIKSSLDTKDHISIRNKCMVEKQSRVICGDAGRMVNFVRTFWMILLDEVLMKLSRSSHLCIYCVSKAGIYGLALRFLTFRDI